MKILYLLVARGGSKGVVDKNLQEVGGLSLVGYKVRSALKSKYCDRVVVSTDSKRIQEEATKHGADSPFVRPDELATDGASSSDVIAHALDWLEFNENQYYDAVMLLEPSSPFALPKDYDGAVEMMSARTARAVLGVRPVTVASIFAGELDADGGIRAIAGRVNQLMKVNRQEVSQEYTMNGALYLFKCDMFKAAHSVYGDPENTYGYVMDSFHSVEIDEIVELEWARFLVEYGRVKVPE